MKKIILILVFLFALTLNAQVKYQLYADPQLINKSRELLKQQVGVKEKTGHNDGPEVEMYLASVGAHKGDPWCMSLQFWCYDMSARILGMPSSHIPIPKTALANNVFVYAKNKGIKVSYTPKINDFLIYRLQGSTYKGHIARIDSVKKSGWVDTIEGNTSSGLKGNQQDGEGCYRRLKNIYHPLGRLYVRGLVGVAPNK